MIFIRVLMKTIHSYIKSLAASHISMGISFLFVRDVFDLFLLTVAIFSLVLFKNNGVLPHILYVRLEPKCSVKLLLLFFRQAIDETTIIMPDKFWFVSVAPWFCIPFEFCVTSPFQFWFSPFEEDDEFMLRIFTRLQESYGIKKGYYYTLYAICTSVLDQII